MSKAKDVVQPGRTAPPSIPSQPLVSKRMLPSMQLDDRAESLLNPRFPSCRVCDLGWTFEASHCSLGEGQVGEILLLPGRVVRTKRVQV